MLRRVKAGSQNGTEDKREAGSVGGEKIRQTAIQKRAPSSQVLQQAVRTGAGCRMQAGWSLREPSNTLTSAESSFEVTMRGWMGPASLVACSRTPGVRADVS